MRPDTAVVLGRRYKIQYYDNPSDVDVLQQKALWGCVDYWTRTIRIYAKDRAIEDIWETILHEVLHAITQDLNLNELHDDEDTMTLLGVGLADTLIRNDWLRVKEGTDDGK